MLNRFIRVTSDFTCKKASQSAAWAVVARDTVSGFITTAHHALMVLGIIAIAALGIMFVKPEVTDHLKALSPFAQAETEEMEVPPVASLMDMPTQSIVRQEAEDKAVAAVQTDDKTQAASSRQQQWVTAWLAKRYRVATDATDMLVSAAYLTAKEIKLDPLLILSVMAIESRFNPFAESPVGAQGLMQVMSKVHRDKFEELGGVKAALNPIANIKVGSLILKDYVTRGGSVEAGLKLYVGAGAFESDAGYGAKVLAEYQRLKEVAMGKKVPIYSTSASAAPKARPQERKPQTEEAANATESDNQPLAQADHPSAL
ncbi:lytic transglycosylase domain-containing protein [Noviherbaspirillum sp.]|uniref:lytic transglycosylase domain-containing protein n=1 Tax=Noviherbaspirillum sp. TaxID=1926288 RepID=UPI002D5F96BA|nr:lytic transglycosylase domain-containing protein [Noviherbaspirillum sp.]HZW19787.1 lytic transglycosylase domain-containing protein [Noviherbaspirillum sp.]